MIPDFLFEPKFDGFRALAPVRGPSLPTSASTAGGTRAGGTRSDPSLSRPVL